MTDWMGRALALAGHALGNTAPNPPVGALIVRGDAVIGEGWTQPAGQAHAEVMALRDCEARGHDPRGATMVATLEPCCHHGRTPPCTDAIVRAGITRVIVGVRDPNPQVRGKGVAALRTAGIEVVVGVEQTRCARRILGFARALAAGLPEVTSKAGISADGRIATASGESRWITGEAAREAGRRLRAEHDAVLVGIGTALADDPALTTRVPGLDRDAVPVVLDSRLRLPASARLARGSRRAVVLCTVDAPDRPALADVVDVVRVAAGSDGRVDPEAALRALASRGLHRVLVEGGGQVHRALLDRGLVDTLELFVAPLLVPGGLSFVGGEPLAALAEAPRMRVDGIARVGDDVRLTFALAHRLAPDPLGELLGDP